MKILYGVQGTGNGHISRANAMAQALKEFPDIDVTWLLSGREKALGCGEIKNFIWREGMTFVAKKGKVKLFDTFKKNSVIRFNREVKDLDLRGYDKVICDYEPVVAHAAKKRGVPLIGISHQYSFNYDIPKRGANFLAQGVMDHFAPVEVPVGLHWHHYGFPILPPIIDLHLPDIMPEVVENKVIVYLAFEELSTIFDLLKKYKDYEFYIYHPQAQDEDKGNLHTRAISRTGFKNDLFSSESVICNTGFELISECLELGKNILTKPMHGQMEQLSNGRALSELGYAEIVDDLSDSNIKSWLQKDKNKLKIHYPNVAEALAQWISKDCRQPVESLAEQLWKDNAPMV